MAQATLSLPDEAWERARIAAELAHRPVEEYLADQLARDFQPGAGGAEPDPDLEQLDLSGLADEQLGVLIFTQLPNEIQDRLAELQSGNTEGALSEDESREFARLQKMLHASTMLKAQALLAWKRKHGRLPDEIAQAL